MTEKTTSFINTGVRIIGVVAIMVALVGYISTIDHTARSNTRQIELNRTEIKRSSEANQEINSRLVTIETHLIYIRESMDKEL